MTDLEKAEARIVELCEAAEAKGWRFRDFVAPGDGGGSNCGCALQACESETGTQWRTFGFELKIRPVSFGLGFDHEARGNNECESYFYDDLARDCYRLGRRLARRFVKKDGVAS